MQLTDGHVLTCLAEECGYNRHEMCGAPNITVGADHPMCDTYTTSTMSALDHEAKVMSCDVADCHFNRGSSCHAAGITLTRHETHADCATYRA